MNNFSLNQCSQIYTSAIGSLLELVTGGYDPIPNIIIQCSSFFMIRPQNLVQLAEQHIFESSVSLS